MKVLVVDDETAIVTLYKQYLQEGKGHKGWTATSGREAIEKTWECRPDLIILDTFMHGLSSFDVMEILKEDPETARIPIILSSTSDRAFVTRNRKLDILDFLDKPIDFDKLKPAHQRPGKDFKERRRITGPAGERDSQLMPAKDF